jgi:alkanesulfonate monooxygenase SsuD/methylene tetrahydromethanopterin reductase-like flavin-dependent oxidoreductase (luciferase family)
MRLGALLGPVVDAGDAKCLADQAKMFAGEGYTSLWSAQAIGRGFMVTDPFVALAAAAAVTDGVELGTAVLQVPLYHPMDLAHRVFSLQQLSGNRFIFGVGAGSTESDFNAYGREFTSRFSDFNASLEVLRQIFTSGGIGDNQLSPWPQIEGGPPIYYGTWGKGVVRAANEFDGWIASGHYRSVDEVCAALEKYRAAGGGRAIVSTLQVGADTDLGEFGDKLQRFAAAGFDDAVVMLLPGAPSPAEIRKLVA